MSRFIFIHDFYRDGYNDVQAEVRVLQACGLWTKEKRASVARQEVSAYHEALHDLPGLDTGYWAGRVAAIKSATTAHYPTGSKTMFVPLADEQLAFCGSCGAPAVWKSAPLVSGFPVRFRCDHCKQEWVRSQIAYRTPDGWDWDEHEDLFLPGGNKLVVKERVEMIYTFSRYAALPVFGVLSITLHIPMITFVLQVLLGIHFLHGFRTFFKSER